MKWRGISHLYEVLTAVLFVTGVVMYAICVPPQRQIDQKWIGLLFNSLFVFGLSIAMAKKRQLFKKLRFWLAWILLLGLHCIAFYFILVPAESWPLVRYIPSDAAEIALLERLITALSGAGSAHLGSRNQ